MPRTRSAARNFAEYALARTVLAALAHAPRPLAERLAGACGRLLDRAVPRLRRVAERNLAMALPGEDHKAVIDGVFASIGRLLLVFARFPRLTPQNISEWIRYEGVEHFHEAKKRGRGVLFATGHFGNWELSAFFHGMATEPMQVVVRPLDNPLLDRLVARYRALSGNRVIEKKDFARGMLKALAANEAVGILIDQNASLDQCVFSDFFGIPAAASPSFAKLAAHSGAAVIPGFALWEASERRYVLRFYPPIDITGDPARDTQALQSKLEEIIRLYPGQWLWIHRRWKTRPPGEPELYN